MSGPATPEALLDVLVVGAGISGLTAAHRLRSRGLNVLVLDKARGVGGRMATRRDGVGTFDHGAQFFTRADPALATWFAPLESSLRSWDVPFGDAAGALPSRAPVFVGAAGMTSLPKALASQLEVELSSRVLHLEQAGRAWSVVCESGKTHSARALLLTCPVPQTVAILDASAVSLAAEWKTQLAAIEYESCIALLYRLEAPSAVPAPGGLFFRPGEPIRWICDNSQKGISSVPSLTVQLGPMASRKWFDAEPGQLSAEFSPLIAPWLGGPVMSFQKHGWRYSLPTRCLPVGCADVGSDLPLVLAGDAFDSPRVEGAIRSGLSAAQYLAGRIAK